MWQPPPGSDADGSRFATGHGAEVSSGRLRSVAVARPGSVVWLACCGPGESSDERGEMVEYREQLATLSGGLQCAASGFSQVGPWFASVVGNPRDGSGAIDRPCDLRGGVQGLGGEVHGKVGDELDQRLGEVD